MAINNKYVQFNSLQLGNLYKLIDIDTNAILNVEFKLLEFNIIEGAAAEATATAKFLSAARNEPNMFIEGKIHVVNNGKTMFTFDRSPFNDNRLAFYIGTGMQGGRRRSRTSRKSRSRR
jgi:hypothetical protein